jgi:hypothetical protein
MRELKEMQEEAEKADELFDEDGVSYEDLPPRKRRALLALKGLVRIDELVEASGFGRQLQEELEAVSSSIVREFPGLISFVSTCTMSPRSLERTMFPVREVTRARRNQRMNQKTMTSMRMRWTTSNGVHGTFAWAIPKLRTQKMRMMCPNFTITAPNALSRLHPRPLPPAVTSRTVRQIVVRPRAHAQVAQARDPISNRSLPVTLLVNVNAQRANITQERVCPLLDVQRGQNGRTARLRR